MGLMERTKVIKKRFSGRNIHILKALVSYIENGHIEESDDIEIFMNIGTYDKILSLGLYHEVKRGRRERREGDR